MKTRIVYPPLWFDEKFALCKVTTKLLFMYLITNDHLGLSVYSRISDRLILFETGLNPTQLAEGKKELEELKWVFFKDGEWQYHHHKCAYVDYVRNEWVTAAKQNEIKAVPKEIVEHFNQIVSTIFEGGFKRSYNINNKQEIINNISSEKIKKSYGKLTDLTETDFKEIAEKYNCSISFVKNKFDDMVLWVGEKHGRDKGRNFRMTLMSWVKRDAQKLMRAPRTPKDTFQPLPELTPEQHASARKKLQEIKEAFSSKI